MKRLTIKIIIAVCTFVVGIGAVIAWLNKSTVNSSAVQPMNNETEISSSPKIKVKEVANDFSPIIELWLSNKIKGNKVKFSVEINSVTGELIQLNAGKEKELIVTTCPTQSKDFNPKCTIAVYEKNGKGYKKLLDDELDWQYSVNDGEIVGGIFARWEKGNYKDLHILSNGTENIYFYNGSEYKLKQQITYTM